MESAKRPRKEPDKETDQMVRTTTVLTVLLVISYVIPSTRHDADAGRPQVACDIRWNREAAQEERDGCFENLILGLKWNRKLVVYIVSYAGRLARANEARDTANDIRRYLIDKRGTRDRQIVALDGGFRADAAVELFLAPAGSQIPTFTPTVDPDMVEFIEDTPAADHTVRLTNAELLKSAIEKPEPVYPPLARATRVEGDVGVKVLIDDSGNVIATRVVYGHPLLRDSAEKAAQRWRFAPILSAPTPVKAVGLLKFHFVLSSTKPDLIQTE